MVITRNLLHMYELIMIYEVTVKITRKNSNYYVLLSFTVIMKCLNGNVLTVRSPDPSLGSSKQTWWRWYSHSGVMSCCILTSVGNETQTTKFVRLKVKTKTTTSLFKTKMLSSVLFNYSPLLTGGIRTSRCRKIINGFSGGQLVIRSTLGLWYCVGFLCRVFFVL